MTETVRTEHATIEFDGQRCIHARQCVLKRPDVFVPNAAGEWIHPECASAAELLEIAHNCPSGAIQAQHPDGSTMEQPPLVNTVRVMENGPLALHADFTHSATGVHEFRATLCRCGASRNKPFCDHSHADAGFTATGEPPEQSSEALPTRNGPVLLEPKPDGPLHLSGPLEVITGTGKTIHRATELWLCRCGQSNKKPYCDGSHVKAGFKSETPSADAP